jgi:hypothetical protein
MLRALKAWFGDKRSKRRANKETARTPRRTRLQVETLERRELLDATFTLDPSGNLYNTSGTQRRLIDTGVQNFTVVNNRVIDLHTSGVLEALNPDGSGSAVLDTGVTAFALGTGGNAITLDGRGYVEVNGFDQGVRGATGLVQGVNNLALILTSDGRIHAFDGVHPWVDEGVIGATALAQGINNQGLILTSDGHVHRFDGVHPWIDEGVSGATGMVQSVNNQAVILTVHGYGRAQLHFPLTTSGIVSLPLSASL